MNASSDTQPLVRKPSVFFEDDNILPDSSVDNSKDAEDIESNFKFLSIAFSLNHGCLVSCVAYASTTMGDRLGSYGNGVLYVVFAFSAACIAKPFLAKYGSKVSLLVGVLGNFIYVASFFAAILSREMDTTDDIDDDTVDVEPRWALFLLGCAIGGLAGGLMWTAQGRYFANSAHLYAINSSVNMESASTTFAAIFALYYLSIEMVLKMLATIIFFFEWYAWNAEVFVFGIYACISFVSAVTVLFVDEYGNEELTELSIYENSKESLKSVLSAVSDLRLALILPFQVVFGLATSFMNYYIFGTVVSDSSNLGETYVGFLSALIVFTGAVIALPSAFIANMYGKPLVMTMGGICLSGFGLICFIFSSTILGTWLMIIPLMIVFGLARGIWENANRAVVADFFVDSPDFSTSAFAAITFFNGLAASFGYFVFYLMTRMEIAGIITGLGIVSIACYLISVHLPAATADQNRRLSGSGRSTPNPEDLFQ